MGLLTLPRVFANLTTSLLSYLDDNFNAIKDLVNGNLDATNVTDSQKVGGYLPSKTSASNKVAVTGTDGKLDNGFLKASATPSSGIIPIADSNGLLNSFIAGGAWRISVVEIGDWRMNAVSAKQVNHNLTMSKIRLVRAFIRNDVHSDITDLETFDIVSAGKIAQIDTVKIWLERTGSGKFDHGDYAASSYNRGWVVIIYEG